MKGKIVLITGSTSGIGKQTAVELATLGATVLIHARSIDEGLPVLSQLEIEMPAGFFDLFIADFEKLDEIQQMATEIEATYGRLDVLINNVASYKKDKGFTEDAIERTFAVNHLGAFLLTHLLMRLLKNVAHARIINVSSQAHFQANFDIRNLQGEKAYEGVNMYCNSKLCNLLFTYQLAERLKRQSITVNAVPGLVATELYADLFSQFEGETPEDAADTIIYMASSPEVELVTGEYFISGIPMQSSYISYTGKYQRQLWKLSERLTGIESSNYFLNAQLPVHGKKRWGRLLHNLLKAATKALKQKESFEYNVH